MATRTQALIEKIEALPPQRVAEVEDFVEFLSAKTQRLAALDRLLEIAPALEATGTPSIAETDILTEIAEVRGARRAGI